MSKKRKLFNKKKHELVDTKKKFTAGSVYTTLAIIAVLCFVAGYFVSGGSPGTELYAVGDGNTKTDVDVIGSGDAPQATTEPVTSAENHMYYITSTGCSSCEALKSSATEIAGKLGIGVTVIEYTQQMSIPGYVLIYNNKLTINGISSKYSFEQTVCDITNNKDVCDMATKDKPADEVPPAPDVPKSDKPKMEVFIMSYCPYGLQMEKATIPVMETLGDKADISIKWVNYIMHGEKERDENTRQYCIEKEQNDKFTDYFRCFAPAGDWEGCLDEIGIDKEKLDACIEATNIEFNIMEDFANPVGNYPKYGVYDTENTNYGVRGSPTTVVNGVVASVSRSPQAVLDAVCAAFNDPPEECDTELSAAAEAAGLGPLGSGDGSASSGGCG